MSDHESGEYELADLPEVPEAKTKPKAAPETGKPLPRLWKTESDEDEASEPPARKAAEPETPAAEPPRASRPRPKPRKDAADGSGKKALVEETPALDTYEARQRGRLLLGLLVPACLGIFGWIAYRVFLYDPYSSEINEEEPPVAAAPAAPKKDLDLEARSLFDRAHDTARRGQTDESVRMLELIVKSYPNTKTASEAKEALDRPGQNLPLFLDRPTITAEPTPKPEPAAPAPTPRVVQAVPRPARGNATLTPPTNPAELTATNASPLAMAPAPDVATPTAPPARKLPAGFSAQPEAGVHSSGWPLVIKCARDGAPMLLVPGAVFTMGNDGGPPNESPAHRVRLGTYYVDQHEVTVRQFKVFLFESHYRGQPSRSWSEDFRQNPSETMPMVMVNARDAQAYAEWAQKKMPTEAQWEMAARGTDGRLYPWGGQTLPDGTLKSASQPGPAMAVREDRSPFGAFDMGGNVLEWTKDWYDSKYYRTLSPDITDNPGGPAAKPRSLELVVKGDRRNGSAAARQGINLEKRLTYVGFRCVLPVGEQATSIAPAAPVTPTPNAQPAPAAQPQPQPPGQPAPPARPGQDNSVPF